MMITQGSRSKTTFPDEVQAVWIASYWLLTQRPPHPADTKIPETWGVSENIILVCVHFTRPYLCCGSWWRPHNILTQFVTKSEPSRIKLYGKGRGEAVEMWCALNRGISKLAQPPVVTTDNAQSWGDKAACVLIEACCRIKLCCYSKPIYSSDIFQTSRYVTTRWPLSTLHWPVPAPKNLCWAPLPIILQELHVSITRNRLNLCQIILPPLLQTQPASSK